MKNKNYFENQKGVKYPLLFMLHRLIMMVLLNKHYGKSKINVDIIIENQMKQLIGSGKNDKYQLNWN